MLVPLPRNSQYYLLSVVTYKKKVLTLLFSKVMKKNLLQTCYYAIRELKSRKIVRIMKLSTFFFFLLIMQLHAENIQSQTASVAEQGSTHVE